jgi:hypothetical protein
MMKTAISSTGSARKSKGSILSGIENSCGARVRVAPALPQPLDGVSGAPMECLL